MWKPINPRYFRDIDPYSGEPLVRMIRPTAGISPRPSRSCSPSRRKDHVYAGLYRARRPPHHRMRQRARSGAVADGATDPDDPTDDTPVDPMSEHCLCPVDVEAWAEASGYDCRYDPMGHVIKKRTKD